ncbi:ABC-three component system protein, partial [Pseudomonas rubra]
LVRSIPSDIWVEIGKIIYYSFKEYYIPPRRHYFAGSQDIGTTLEQLLNNPEELQFKAEENWNQNCKSGITSTTEILLSGELLHYFQAFDFSIFSSKSVVELIEGHSRTQFHSVRFGGGLPFRPDSLKPPEVPAGSESRYIRQIFDAYGNYLGKAISGEADLESHGALKRDYLRQRERFYHAESLRNFARDTVPEGTFTALQDEIYYGVVDVCEDDHADGFARMKATITHSSTIAASANALASAFKTQDRQGICHQLANDDRLAWVPEDE